VPVQHGQDETGRETLDLLAGVIIPENDPAALAVRLGGVAGPVPETVPATADPLEIGARQVFWASDTDTNENF
jgi:hypothetical protein